MITLKDLLAQLHENLNHLKNRAAQYGGPSAAPLEVINGISAHEEAIEKITPLLEQEPTQSELQALRAELKPLLLPDSILSLVDKLEAELPRLPVEPELVFVPAGPFLMGSPPGEGVSKWESPQHEVDLLEFYIGKYPITNRQFAQFIEDTKNQVNPATGWDGQLPPSDRLDHPITGVTWFEALDYCRWLTGQTEGQRRYSLPSEAQWEKAARSVDGGRVYPWGNDWEEKRCHHNAETSAPVDAYPAQSNYGCYDMVGNAPEWTCTLWGPRLIAPEKQYRYPWVNDGRQDLEASKRVLRVYRGGGFAAPPEKLRCSARAAYFPDKPGAPGQRHGFRVVMVGA